MHLFADYVQPLTLWLHQNPNWALLITFLVSNAESLAIVGSIIPGSLTMTAIGIMAGSGVMRLDLTLAAASLGAIVGDGASYALGYVYSERIAQMWPFHHYPNLMRYGKDFFSRHGGKSVLIGRFVGPLRSIIPVIAGMMRMPHFQFFLSNVISAIGWALLYVMPGYLIGAASHQLSNESAKRFMMFMIILLLGVWLGGRIVHWILQGINRYYAKRIEALTSWFKHHACFNYFFQGLGQPEATQQTTMLLLWMGSVAISLFLIVSAAWQPVWMNAMNIPILLFLQSLRTGLFDIFFILVSFVASPLSLLGLLLVFLGSAIYARDWRLCQFWLSLTATTLIFACLLAHWIPIFGLPHAHGSAAFPDLSLTALTALLSFTLLYLKDNTNPETFSFLRILFIMLMILAGFSRLYLGDNAFSSVFAAYSVGFSLSVMHWILYLRYRIKPRQINMTLVLAILALILTTTLEYHYHFQCVYKSHLTHHQQYELTEAAWWYQEKPLLPIYTTNRMGRSVGLFNIQYVGSLPQLASQLETCGWKKQSKTWLYSILLRVNGQHALEALPWLEQLYLNQKPILTMTYHEHKHNHVFLLRLWRSNYFLLHDEKPIWLGSVILLKKKNQFVKAEEQTVSKAQWSTLFGPIFPAIKTYQVRSVVLKDEQLKALRYVIPPELLIIKNSFEG